jgi:hypothetical protein
MMHCRRPSVRRLAWSGYHARARFAVRAAETHAQLVKYYAPRELEGGVITISPVEWTE